jgi:hypothetical protein
MLVTSRVVEAFPSARISPGQSGLPVEVALILQLGHGSGDRLIASAAVRQRGHAEFVDALDEPSARIAAPDFANGDATALFSFIVGAHGHPFHRHAGHRVFTAISGSGGVQLRFSTASCEDAERDSGAFRAKLRCIDIPPDCLFIVRFGGGVWHQFVSPNTAHPAMFALSCHTNELGGDLDADVRAHVLANDASIAMLTEVAPSALTVQVGDSADIPTVALSLDAAPYSLLARFCRIVRGALGRLRSSIVSFRRVRGFYTERGRRVEELDGPSADSLLRTQLTEEHVHGDAFELVVPTQAFGKLPASAILSAILDGFVKNPPPGVTRLMSLRNALVRPLGLRTSSLGCPVSSLGSSSSEPLFANRFPVRAQRIDALDRRAEVILGIDDRHLVFRSCVGVVTRSDGTTAISLATRTKTLNLFGKLYMRAIDRAHRRYVAPAMLRFAVEYALRKD